MPLKKRVASSESEEEDTKPVTKKEKKDSSGGSKDAKPTVDTAGEIEENDQGDKYIKLSEYRRLTVRRYNKKVLVDFREYYKDKETGEMKPGSKGVSLTPEQWKIVAENTDAIDGLVAKLS